MSNGLVLRSFSSGLILSFCLLPQSALGMIIDGESPYRGSAKQNSQSAQHLPYKVCRGQIAAKDINVETFYSLISKAGFTEDDFPQGKYGHQDQIYLKQISFGKKALPGCAFDMKNAILSTLKKVTQPYVAFILEVDKTVPYTLTDVRRFGGQKSIFNEIEPLAEIVSQEENRIYVVYYNDIRSTLDLHKLALNEAKDEAIDFIREKHDNFETECTIITGRGNHINSNGASGVLNHMLPIWAQESELRPYIKNVIPCNGGGMYKVKLFKPTHITLSNVFGEDVENVINFIFEENKKGHNRLKIIDKNQTSKYIDDVIGYALPLFSRSMSFPISFNYGPKSGQLIWEVQAKTYNAPAQKAAQPKQNNVQPQQYNTSAQKAAQPKQNNVQPQQYNTPAQKAAQPKQNNVQPQQYNTPAQKAAQPKQNNVQPQQYNTPAQKAAQPKQNNVQPQQYNTPAQKAAQQKQNNPQKKKKPF